MDIEKLSNQNHWEDINSNAVKNSNIKTKGKGRFKLFTSSYLNQLLWDVTLPKYIEKNPLHKVIEIGSAPGNNLVKWHHQFQHIPYGVEYTESGLKLNQELFIANNLDPQNIIQADFFSESFLSQNKEKYDAVFSMGFIEHFDDPASVIKNHIELLKPGGTLFISIPNLKGLYHKVLKTVYPEILDIHNLNIMEFENFTAAFEKQSNLQKLYCGYLGTIDLNILQFKRYQFVGKLFRYFQMGLNFLCKIFLGNRGLETRTFSPYIVYIGKKN